MNKKLLKKIIRILEKQAIEKQKVTDFLSKIGCPFPYSIELSKKEPKMEYTEIPFFYGYRILSFYKCFEPICCVEVI